MKQTRRQFVTTAAALAVSPALPVMAVTEAWPPEVLELEQIARQIHGCQAKQDLYSIMYHHPEYLPFEERAEACLQRGLARYHLGKLAPQHEPARAALARYLADGTLPQSPRPVPPFLDNA